jgi:hypothetical protein
MVYNLATEELVYDREFAMVTKKYKHERAYLNYPSRRLFHGLTQVCRQLRDEFRPLYIERNEICVRAEESAEYIWMMWDLATQGAPIRLFAARVAVVLDRNDKVDILSTHKICGISSMISARFIDSRYRNTQDWQHSVVNMDLQAMFTDDRSKWLGLYHGNFTKVTMSFPTRLPVVEITLKKGFIANNMLQVCHGARYKFIMVVIRWTTSDGTKGQAKTPLVWLAKSLNSSSFKVQRFRLTDVYADRHLADDYGGFVRGR